MQDAQQAGFEWVRIFLKLDDLVQTSAEYTAGPTQWHWPDLSAAHADFPSILLVVTGNPPWNKTAATVSCEFQSRPWAFPPIDSNVLFEITKQVAIHFKDQVAAYEIWNEPTSCIRWRGTRAEFKTQILPYYFDGLRAGDSDALIGGVALAGRPNRTDVENWLTDSSGNMIRPFNFISVHEYDDPTSLMNKQDSLNGFSACYNPPTGQCTSKFWITEWGEANDAGSACEVCQQSVASDPGNAIKNILEHCNGLANCQRMFYFTLDDSWLDDPGGCASHDCSIALIKNDGTARAKYDDLKAYQKVDVTDVAWSNFSPVFGYHCINVNEPLDPHAWADNYVCTKQDVGLEWSYNGPIANKVCVKIEEPSDPDGWNDNYLCSRWSLGMKWSYAGPVAGMGCINFDEGIEPAAHTWSDNYLCFPPE